MKKSVILLTKKQIGEKEALENPDFDECVIDFEDFIEISDEYDKLIKNTLRNI